MVGDIELRLREFSLCYSSFNSNPRNRMKLHRMLRFAAMWHSIGKTVITLPIILEKNRYKWCKWKETRGDGKRWRCSWVVYIIFAPKDYHYCIWINIIRSSTKLSSPCISTMFLMLAVKWSSCTSYWLNNWYLHECAGSWMTRSC